ncbi:DNA replication terminus site binding protein [Pseudomonas duriflava]|uniref:DNA replication terminus site binding protein n=1 Tax=Pseudomonas duriflava TaxID=459528 RepID=A0A562Q8V8_9PSED|nr:DNA replication terminus site-binding protein [Pseudomonas duriflava]TWI52466.1 DNA replication terminus site binding protein [Pseudomonas duriflava]
MISDLRDAWQEMLEAQRTFNSLWPSAVVHAQVWLLPINREAKGLTQITPHELVGEPAIEATKKAILQFEQEEGQHPSTVMRLPGWIGVSGSVLEAAREANAARDRFLHVLAEDARSMNLKSLSKGKHARTALKLPLVIKQIERHIQVFEGVPRRILFTWAGKTAAPESIPVKDVIEKVELQLAEAVAKADMDKERGLRMELKALGFLDSKAELHRYRPIAPHPRVMLYFSKSSRYDAMPHANLPIFVSLDEKQPWPKVDPLEAFDAEQAQAERSDKVPRQEIIPRLGLYLKTTDRKRRNASVATAVETLPRTSVISTYGQRQR